MIKHVQVWSHRDIEYLVPLSERYRAKAQELIYPRVSIASVFNGSKTLFGIAVQHPEDKDNKKIGQEAAVENALINPVLIINSTRPLTEKAFDKFSWGLYEVYSPGLRPVASYDRDYLPEDFCDYDCDCCGCNCCGEDPESNTSWASTCPCEKNVTCTEPLNEPIYVY